MCMKRKQASEHYGVSVDTLDNWRKHHGLPWVKAPTGVILINISKGDAWLDAFSGENINDKVDKILEEVLGGGVR